MCVCVCIYPGEGNVAFNATPNPFLLNKICLIQIDNDFGGKYLCVEKSESFMVIEIIHRALNMS